jgi:hypothetical protein
MLFLYKLINIYKRLILSYFVNKENFIFKNSNDVFTEIKDSNFWTSSESISGPGSDVKNTTIAKNTIEFVIQKYDIKTILDIPCGDFNYMKNVNLKDCYYIGADIVSSIISLNTKLYKNNKIEFRKLDITSDVLPLSDLIICKDCLQHLSNENVNKALINLVNSGSKYLLVTSYPLTIRNYDIYDGDYRALNLFRKPFKLKKYLFKATEIYCSAVEIDKTLYLFDLTNHSFNKYRI